LYRLQGFVTASDESDVADAGAWPRQTESCAICHGKHGHSVNPRYPNLAGLPADYIEAQLRAFASGQRHDPNMSPLAMDLSEKDIKGFAAYYAKQTLQPNPYSKPQGDAGKRLVEEGDCAACHGPGLTGQGAFPRLAGQGSDYLAKQLDAFASGARVDASGAMKPLAAARTPDERRAIANYLASLGASRK
jgi:cytochrome c553